MSVENSQFRLVSDFQAAGDQPAAIKQLAEGIEEGERHQVLLGVTGSGKTYTMANVIEQVQRPTLVFSHNKTLAAQLYTEFKSFFPDSLVEYFVSYYDYYQPEAYIASTDTFIEKDMALNAELERMRLKATAALLSGRRDVIIVASVSCIYGIGKPEEFASHILEIYQGQKIGRDHFLHQLVSLLYVRSEIEFQHGNFRVKGDTMDVFPVFDELGIRIIFFGDEIETISSFDPFTGKKVAPFKEYTLFPANLFVTSRDVLNKAIVTIQDEMTDRVEYFTKIDQPIEAKRIKERTEYDMEFIRELGFCKGIENYSRHLTGRKAGSRPYCLIDYFPDDFLIMVDESHVSLPQVRGMFGGDRSRKMVLVENGFRLPSAIDNRPLKFEEFENIANQLVYVSATPGDYEIAKAEGIVIEQIVRPTGLLDPPVEVRPLYNQVDDLLEEIEKVKTAGHRILVTTLTKRMSEELATYLQDLGIKSRYLHSEIKALERVDILNELREGIIDVLIGVNLLREGLDLPEVALVAILDADKEGFLRSEQAFMQMAGRAARNAEGRVILYADQTTKSMQKLLDETSRRREKQIAYNTEHGLTPRTIIKKISSSIGQPKPTHTDLPYIQKDSAHTLKVAERNIKYMSDEAIKEDIAAVRKKMEAASTSLDFIQAAKYRDEMYALQLLLKKKKQA